jgi:hypothetical protein
MQAAWVRCVASAVQHITLNGCADIERFRSDAQSKTSAVQVAREEYEYHTTLQCNEPMSTATASQSTYCMKGSVVNVCD